MLVKNMILKTRPFQPFFLAAKDLLNLARPYHEQIEQNRKKYEKSGIVKPLSQNIWRLEKSLSIGSFMSQYAGLEAFVNCVYNDFKLREPNSLASEYFIDPISKHRKPF